MTSAERLSMAMSFQEPDRVPFLLPAVLQGARELGMPIKEYFSDPEYVAEGQIRIWEKYQHDALIGFMYGAVEYEAWGGEVIYRNDGPPNSGKPLIENPQNIDKLRVPSINDSPCLQKVLRLISLLKKRSNGEMPVMGSVISPFSLPVMQLGFDHYLDLLYENRIQFEKLISLNEEFCIAWANAQLDAGASAISYADPVSSPSIIPVELYENTGYQISKRVIKQVNGAVAISFASGRCQNILDYIKKTGAVGVSVSIHDDLAEVKKSCYGKLSVMGNLNAIDMRKWTPQTAEMKVKEAIAKAGTGGGFILTDNHGEIPWQVNDDILLNISDAVRKWGQYPLKWVTDYV